jgi:hypothetical protein
MNIPIYLECVSLMAIYLNKMSIFSCEKLIIPFIFVSKYKNIERYAPYLVNSEEIKLFIKWGVYFFEEIVVNLCCIKFKNERF